MFCIFSKHALTYSYLIWNILLNYRFEAKLPIDILHLRLEKQTMLTTDLPFANARKKREMKSKFPSLNQCKGGD